ncbi:hypothetical protein [Flavobacterium sp. TSSA_36]|uniref:hypothetical protein n=1 Tax=Flavobacterium sp. TSSA_36 TaxID=3447669 RepID=UPI003F3E7A49
MVPVPSYYFILITDNSPIPVNTPNSYFFRSFLVIFLAACFFLGLKEVLPKRIFAESKGPSKNVLIDSMLIDAFESESDSVLVTPNDTLADQKIVFEESLGVTFPEETLENYKGYQYLIPFYEQLYQLENNPNAKVRIAYYGDSMTDGDMIVQDIRSAFQNNFGGKGVGFVSISSESAASRSSILHEFSTNWKKQSYLTVKNPIRPFGVNGQVFFANHPSEDIWVKYTAGRYKNANVLDNPTIFYGSSDNLFGVVNYTIATDSVHKTLTAVNRLNTIILKKGSLKTLRLSFKNAQSVPIYGLNFDDGKGVHVDNFSQRGNSGIPISKFDPALMQAFQKKLNYNLIVLHYGTNVLNYGTKDYNWYSRSMTKTVNRLREGFPGASILIVSTADKATKYKTEMKTDSAVVPLTFAQRNYALKTQSAYVNLYTLMGGDGSIVKWVENEPVLANKDYTHFNIRGSKKVAGLLYQHLMKGYQDYKRLRNTANAVKPKIQKDTLLEIPIETKLEEVDEH